MTYSIAVYIGSQERLTGSPIALFNLLRELPSIDKAYIHCVDSTVSAQTLRANGVRVPRVLFVGQVLTTISHNRANKACDLCPVSVH